MAGGFQTAIGVLWDVNTCPVSDGMDPSLVRPSIISALQKFVDGPCRVTIFAVGNLDNVSPDMLKQICSSGILISHTVFRMLDIFEILTELKKRDPRIEKLLLISGDTSWQYPYYDHGYLTILRAYPKDLNPVSLCAYKCAQEWVWENLLEEYSRGALQKNMKRRRMDDVESALSCTLCQRQFSSQSVDDFINHLKTDEKHKQKYFRSVYVDANRRPFLFCEACQYPGYDGHNMAIHLKSSEHKYSLYKTVGGCNFCNYTGNDMAIHYNREEHTQKEIAFVLADARLRRHAAIKGEDSEEEDSEEEEDCDEEDCHRRERTREG